MYSKGKIVLTVAFAIMLVAATSVNAQNNDCDGTVKVFRVHDTVFIVGDRENNCLEINGNEDDSCDISVIGDGTEIDGEDQQDGAKKIIVWLKGGEDTLELENIDCRDSDWLISLNQGNDEAFIFEVEVRKLMIDMGPGVDEIGEIDQLSVRKRSFLKGGFGDSDGLEIKEIEGPVDIIGFEEIFGEEEPEP